MPQPLSVQRRNLIDAECFVLDNSLRESTVGQLRGHTLENKWKIYEQVKKVGYQNIIVASFNHMTRVGDVFIEELKSKGEDFNKFWAFSEFLESIDKNGVPDTETIPIGLVKCKKLGIRHVVIEFDLVYKPINYKKFKMKDIARHMVKLMTWIRTNLSKDSKIVFNIRDFPKAMHNRPKRVIRVVRMISKLKANERPFGFVYEDPYGKWLPEEIGCFTATIREVMDNNNWKNGHFLCHIHEQWGLSNATTLQCLANGATGIWASLCKVGAFLGHSSSSETLMNLIRLGNKKVLKNYNCVYLRSAAQAITEVTLGTRADPMQPVYGDRALDAVFGVDAGLDRKDFNMAEFFGVETVMRMTTMASPEMIIIRLKRLFGENKQFNETIAAKMKETMLKDMKSNRKEEYMSKEGLALLFDRSGGKLTAEMAQEIGKSSKVAPRHKALMEEVKAEWDEWDVRDGVKDDQIQFDAFYNGFMSVYFSCYRCDETTQALKALDMDCDGKVDWNEFSLYLKWALRQYPEISTRDELIDTAFRKGLIPAMQDSVKITESDDEADDDDEEDDDLE